MSAYKLSIKERYAAFTKRAAQLKRLRAADVVAMKARYHASRKGPTLMTVYRHHSDIAGPVGPRQDKPDLTHFDPVDLHDDKRRRTCRGSFIGVSKHVADVDKETDKIADAFAKLSVKSETSGYITPRAILAAFRRKRQVLRQRPRPPRVQQLESAESRVSQLCGRLASIVM